jgi:putative DNA primase/helicase
MIPVRPCPLVWRKVGINVTPAVKGVAALLNSTWLDIHCPTNKQLKNWRHSVLDKNINVTTQDAKQAARKLTQGLINQGYEPTGFYEYTDKEGLPLFWRIRLDHPTKGKEFRPLSFNGSKWVLKEPKFPKGGKPLYRLHEIVSRPNETVWIVEGEKCADAFAALGLLATTSGSASTADGTDWSVLSGRKVKIWPDNDEPGLKYAREVTKQLLQLNCDVQWVDISKLGWSVGSVGSDGVDWILLYPDATKKDIEALAMIDPEVDIETPSDEQSGDSKSPILDQIAESCELFHSPDRKGYATVPINSHKETWSLESAGFKEWLGGRCYQFDKTIPKSNALADLIETLKGVARHDGDEHPVFIRLAEKDGRIYLDLGNEKWGVVEITANGWNIISNPPVKFIRPRSLHTLPRPERGGSINELSRFLNVRDDDLILVIGFLLFCLTPNGPYPILIIQGEQGSAKSTFGRVLRSLIDPSSAMLRSAPKREHDLMIAAQNGWLLSFDNLSSLKQEMSDSLCRLATGGGFSTRQLYTDGEEIIFEATRPICLNGITEFATRDDLLDRALIIKLPPIPSEKRMEEKAFLAEFEKARPRILGALLDGVSAALKNLPDVKLAELPRMADFAKFVTAAESAFGWNGGAFMDAYVRNRDFGREIVLESDSVAQAILSWNPVSWYGTATELLVELGLHVPENLVRSQYWPKGASVLSNRLRRLLPALREKGFDIDWASEGKGREKRKIIRINKVEESSTDPTDLD